MHLTHYIDGTGIKFKDQVYGLWLRSADNKKDILTKNAAQICGWNPDTYQCDKSDSTYKRTEAQLFRIGYHKNGDD